MKFTPLNCTKLFFIVTYLCTDSKKKHQQLLLLVFCVILYASPKGSATRDFGAAAACFGCTSRSI